MRKDKSIEEIERTRYIDGTEDEMNEDELIETERREGKGRGM